MTHGVDHDMPDFDISMLQTIVDDNKVDDSQGVDMESEEEDGDDDIEMPEYVDCSDIYDDDNGEGDEDLDGNQDLLPGVKTMFDEQKFILHKIIQLKHCTQPKLYIQSKNIWKLLF